MEKYFFPPLRLVIYLEVEGYMCCQGCGQEEICVFLVLLQVSRTNKGNSMEGFS